MATWASLLETLAKDNSEAVDFVLQEKIKQAALAEQWISAAQLLFEYISRKPRTRHRAALSDRLFAYLLRADQAALQAERAHEQRCVATMVGYADSLSSGVP